MAYSGATQGRFWAKVERGRGCWRWTGYLDPGGYGRYLVPRGYRQGQRAMRVHRLAYELCVGPIPDGMDIDHLCRVRSCVNPAHLEPVTRRENLLRGATLNAENAAKVACPYGHPYARRKRTGARICQVCKTASERRRLAKRTHRA